MTQAEKHIINNLFECWQYVGQHSRTLATTPSYKTVTPVGSDWPERVFDITPGDDGAILFKEMAVAITEQRLPRLLTFTATESSRYEAALAAAGFVPRMKQMGMIIDLAQVVLPEIPGACTFKAVTNAEEATLFATIAGESFGYRVDGYMTRSLLQPDQRAQLFIGYYEAAPACCGLVFYDEQGYAGLHMIGTLPAFRGKGLAAAITIHLLQQCQKDQRLQVVLHASAAGEPIYTRLGFKPEKEVITWHQAS
ncbi:GNAT family N-acetyltransferase [Chitinophaga nivalis]|uniref:GNAT family N-acetyltransferase n=1 Tax=Chitinophaga nivalis TaxID=2991709 RepID=A0ABT3IMN8_9BACT|nr:GNAT family N-acetyltransferase [Chitinophaga nivalis]MCW3465077.1 GNAT family N-acetyltransferase [Chitinophaga nivalis]MCW3485231.1 GNAT family N-acetyltransferase [Chitinophaga nivalis]